ncbi:hypothetical protein [Pseudonocardia sp.]|uniref:hypothetical protein n=1 Tax=Pseudonocardia sp. TaxID=60912 RepID=UPI0026070F3F|nr:hypothetical protein [Pseudonocardia sp.]
MERTNRRLRFHLDRRELARLAALAGGDLTPLSPAEHRDRLGRLDGWVFRDGIDHAARHGVRHLAEPGGSTRSPDVERACREHGITRAATAPRRFHH